MIDNVIKALNIMFKATKQKNKTYNNELFVLQKNQEVQSGFGLFYTIKYNLILVTTNKNYHILGHSITVKPSEVDKCHDHIDVFFCTELFSIINSPSFTTLILGNYDSYTNE